MIASAHVAGTQIASAIARGRTFLSRLRATVAAVRRQRMILEAELFRGHYRLSSKNDDDLPIVR